MDFATIKEHTTEALHYWEPRRFVYNGVLAAEVILYYFLYLPGSRQAFNRENVLFVFVLAVLANVAYCAAYPVDVFVQMSGFREKWQLYRNILFLIGLLFAAVITRWCSMGIFSTAGAVSAVR